MIKPRSEKPYRPIEIDLSGPEGNVFNIMGMVPKFAKACFDDIHPDLNPELLDLVDEYHKSLEIYNRGKHETLTKMILEDMRSGDYDHAIEVFDRWFGGLVTIYK